MNNFPMSPCLGKGLINVRSDSNPKKKNHINGGVEKPRSRTHYMCVAPCRNNCSERIQPDKKRHKSRSVLNFSSKRVFSNAKHPNMGSGYIRVSDGVTLDPPIALKCAVKKFLKGKKYKQNHSAMNHISEILTGEAFLSGWFYTGIIPYIRWSRGWIRVIKPLPFKFIFLVLRQLAYIPSTVPSSRLINVLTKYTRN